MNQKHTYVNNYINSIFNSNSLKMNSDLNAKKYITTHGKVKVTQLIPNNREADKPKDIQI